MLFLRLKISILLLAFQFGAANAPVFAADEQSPSAVCENELSRIFELRNTTIIPRDQTHQNMIRERLTFVTLKEAHDFKSQIDRHLIWLDDQHTLYSKLDSDIQSIESDCSLTAEQSIGLDRLKTENQYFVLTTLKEWEKDSLSARSSATSFIKNPTEKNLKVVREGQLRSDFMLGLRCYPPQNLSELVCSVAVGRGSDSVDFDIDVDLQVSVKKDSWKTISKKSIRFNESAYVSISMKQSKLKDAGQGKIRAQVFFSGSREYSNEVLYTPVLYPPPWPKWVENCISWDKGMVVNGSRTVSRCDQAYATGPGKWVKNCPVKYDRTLKINIRECVQAYVTNKK